MAPSGDDATNLGGIPLASLPDLGNSLESLLLDKDILFFADGIPSGRGDDFLISAEVETGAILPNALFLAADSDISSDQEIFLCSLSET